MSDDEFDVVVVGSGAGGLLTAIKAHDLGLKVAIIEKTELYGGTSAVSGGGIWIPSNDYMKKHYANADKMALEYLQHCTKGKVSDEKLWAYIKKSAELVPYLKSLGIEYYVPEIGSYPDYYTNAPGAVEQGRSMDLHPIDARPLGNDLYNMRDSLPEFKVFDRVSLTLTEAGMLLARAPGWKWMMAKLLLRYWTDFAGRRKSKRDRRLNIGAALVGGLRMASLERKIPLYLQTRMIELVTEAGAVKGVRVNQQGREFVMNARWAVVLASGGFEQNSELRTKYFPQRTETAWSVTPRDCNEGDGLLAAQAIGAETEFLDEAWWSPTFTTPTSGSPSFRRSAPLFFERGYPHSICVNREGKRFTNEICSYHQFGQAMLRDNSTTGSNLPCWMIIDANYRKKYPLAGILPSFVMPDSALPPEWFDKLIFQAASIEELAMKILIDPSSLRNTVDRFNRFAINGVDEDFGRGDNVYNQFFGDPSVTPNRNLGPLSDAPFYAIRVNLGDIGSKGGPKVDENANVLDMDNCPISGLYATGNVAGSVTAGSYPGAGATLGPAMTFGYIAAEHIAQRMLSSMDGYCSAKAELS